MRFQAATLFLTMAATPCLRAALTFTNSATNLTTGSVSGVVTDTINGDSTNYTITVTSSNQLDASGAEGINWNGAGDSLAGGFQWAEANRRNTVWTLTLVFDKPVSLVFQQAPGLTTGGGDSNVEMTISGYTGLAIVDDPENQLDLDGSYVDQGQAGGFPPPGYVYQAPDNQNGSIVYSYSALDDNGSTDNNVILNSDASWSITTPYSTTYTISYDGFSSDDENTDREWLTIGNGVIQIPEPVSTSYLLVAMLSLVSRRRK